MFVSTNSQDFEFEQHTNNLINEIENFRPTKNEESTILKDSTSNIVNAQKPQIVNELEEIVEFKESIQQVQTMKFKVEALTSTLKKNLALAKSDLT